MLDGDGVMLQLCAMFAAGGGALTIAAACWRAALRLPAGEGLEGRLEAAAHDSAGIVRVTPAESAVAEWRAAARLLLLCGV